MEEWYSETDEGGAYNDMRVQMAIQEQKRKLEAERKESIDRLRQIERRLNKTE